MHYRISPLFQRFAARVAAVVLVVSFAAGSAQAEESSLLWKISGNGLNRPSYVYGTIHIKDKRVFELSDATRKALAETPSFAMELIPDSVDYMSLLPMLLLDSGRTLRDLMPSEDYQFVHAALTEKLGAPQAFIMEKMRPIIISTILSLDNISQDYTVALDEHLYRQAQKDGKTVLGIETVTEQIQAFNSIPLDDQARMLVEQLRDTAKADSSMDALINAYLQADLDALMNLVNEAETQGMSLDVLLDKRNHIMAERIAGFAHTQPVFAAIGAGHLGGEEGVIALLRKRGYTVEPVR